MLSFPPHLVRTYVQRFGLTPEEQVLDPFCGTGTTLVECKKLGIPSVGFEANPMAHFASLVKVDWSPDPNSMVEHSKRIADIALTELQEQGIIDDAPLFAASEQNVSCGIASLRRLEAEASQVLLAGSISPLPLHKTLVLLDVLRRHRDERYHHHQLLALAKALVSSIGNLHFGPEVGVGPAKPDAPVVAPWLSGVLAMADDLRKLRYQGQVQSRLYCADSRQVASLIEPESIGAVITSPPYPNEKDYTRTTRLESVLLGFIHSKADLRALKKSLVCSNTRTAYKDDDDDRWVADNAEIQRIAQAIETRRVEMGKTSGFERLYPRVAKLYFGGMRRHLAELRKLLRPGAQLAYVVGDQASYLRVMIRTGQLLTDIAKDLGYEPMGIDLFRTRLATATREQLREEVVLLRWSG